MIVKQGVDLPKITGRGRPKGAGVNLRLLRSLRPSDTVWEVGKRKMRSIMVSANTAGIKLMVRRIPNTNKYAFRIVEDTDSKDSGEQPA